MSEALFNRWLFENNTTVGCVIQNVYSQTGTMATGTTQIPNDNTIPQSSEGTQFMSLAITPKLSTNKLKITVVVNASYSVSAVGCVALFQDSTANALAAATASIVSSNTQNITLIHYMTAGTVSETTFKVRAGAGSAGTFTFNGIGGVQQYGGVMASSITIEEIQA